MQRHLQGFLPPPLYGPSAWAATLGVRRGGSSSACHGHALFLGGNHLIHLLPFPVCAVGIPYFCAIKTLLKCSAVLVFHTDVPVIKWLTNEVHGACEIHCFICSSRSSLGILIQKSRPGC